MQTYISQLMSKMTLEEKIGQLCLLPGNDIVTGEVMNSPLAKLTAEGKLGSVLNVKGQKKIRELQRVAVEQSRLGIPMLIGMDVIHGNQTVFPIPLAQSCTWNLEAIAQGARIAAKEATAQGINWVYSPMVDICIDPRWGRVAEGSGEDPYLGSRIAETLVKAYQGNYGRQNVMACLKHFALYGGAEAGRDYNTVDMSRLRMYNQYLPPYHAAVKAGVGSVMSSFNVIDYVPATCNDWLLTTLLRDQWKFQGFVVTDYGAIKESVVHGIGDMATCAARALKAGTDMDMCSEAFSAHLHSLYDAGRVSQQDIDQACRRVLEAKYKLGLFQDPYRFCDAKREKTDLYTAEHRQAARNMAAESFVLLKNQNNLLPLKKQGKIALIGPMADDRSNIVGSWSTGDTPDRYSTLREAMLRAVGSKAKILYAQGCNVYADSVTQAAAEAWRPLKRVNDLEAYQEAMAIAAESDVIVCAMGELAEMSGESASRSDLHLPAVQMHLLQDLVKTGKPVVLLNFSGRPTVMTWENAHVPAILNVWFGGSETGDAICDVIFGDKSPSGHLTVTMPRSMGQIPIYYNHLMTGRPVEQGAEKFQKFASNYYDISNDPLFPFGYGLTYTTFEYSPVTLTPSPEGCDTLLTASVTVTNTGQRTADEVVQLYIRDVVGSISRPVKELKGFQRITLQPGESCQVTFPITSDMLKFYNAQLQYVSEPGEFHIMIGSNSRDVQTATWVLGS